MKTVSFILLCFATIFLIAGVQQKGKSELQYARDEFVTDLIYAGLSKENADSTVLTIHPDTLLLFMKAPLHPPIDDSSGLQLVNVFFREINSTKTKGWLKKVVHRRITEENGQGRLVQYDYWSTDIFDLTNTKHKK